MDALDLEFHADRHRDLLTAGNEETKAAARVRVMEDHENAVRSELMKFTEEALAVAEKLMSGKAQQYMRYGVGRRLRMTDVSYREIFDTIAPDRTEPLPRNEMAAVSRDLNVIYVNIRGVLDNYAWCIYLEAGLSKTAKLKDEQVGLFNKQFRKLERLATLRPAIETHIDWNDTLKSRRDPSAHRIPLYVPAATLTDAEAARHNEIWQERLEAIQNGEYDRDTELAEEQSRLGTFRPVFLHDPDKGEFPLYETVPPDVGKLITIGRAIHATLPALSAAAA
jgi:hypothetical protein